MYTRRPDGSFDFQSAQTPPATPRPQEPPATDIGELFPVIEDALERDRPRGGLVSQKGADRAVKQVQQPLKKRLPLPPQQPLGQEVGRRVK